jgi:hypothetical protein
MNRQDLRCVIGGCAQQIERNHPGGRNHVAWFTMPFCREHHDQFHSLLRTAGVNLEWTDDPVERIMRALQATLVAQWMLTETLNNNLKAQVDSVQALLHICSAPDNQQGK